MATRIKRRDKSPLKKKARRGFRGYPMATVAYYGPNDRYASKVVASIIAEENADPDPLEKWLDDDDVDVRHNPSIQAQILAFIQQHGGLSVVLPPGIIGCPHEEGIHYPEGKPCPECPFWAYRDRWTGEIGE